MRQFLFACLVAFVAGTAAAQEIIVNSPSTTIVVPAQEAASQMARTGILRHCGRTGGLREGIGFSSAGPDAALNACCYMKDVQRGRYRIVERGVARGARGWYAVIRVVAN